MRPRGFAGAVLCLAILTPHFGAPPLRAQTVDDDTIRGELRAGRAPDAEKHARELLRATERIHGAESLEVAGVLDLLAEALRRGGKGTDPEARSVCERALAIKARTLPPDDLSYIVSLENLGALHLMNRNLQEARAPLERVLEVRNRVLGPWHPDVARTLLFLGNLAFTSAQDESALVYVERAIAIQDSLLPDEDPARAQSLELLSAIHYQRGEYRESVAVSEQVLALRTRVLGLDHPSTASTLHNLGSVASEMGDLEDAVDYLEASRAVMKRARQARHPMVARTIASLASVREKEGNLSGALALYREAVELQRKIFGPEDQEVAWNTMHAGRLQIELGRTSAARSDLREALRIQEKILPEGHSDFAWTYGALARADAQAGDPALAIEHANRALSIRSKMIGESHPDYAATLVDLASFHALAGDTVKALEAALRSDGIRTEHLRSSAGGLSERQALAYASRGPTGLDVALSLVVHPGALGAPAAVRRAWDAVIQTRTLVLDEMAERHHAGLADTAGTVLADATRQLERARQRLANLLVRGPGDDSPARYQSLIRRARLEAERAERSLGSQRVAATSGEKARGGLQGVIEALPAHWGIVAYASYTTRGVRHYLAFVRTPDAEPLAIPLGPAARVDSLVRRWARDLLSDHSDSGPSAARAEAASRRSGRELRLAVWDPIEQAIDGAAGVVIVPVGLLLGVQFGALPDEKSGYLAERDPLLHYVTSELDLLKSRAAGPRGAGLLAFGGVEFGPGQERGGAATGGNGPEADGEDCTEFYGANFNPLPQSALEVEEIADAWGDSALALVVSGRDATESAFKRLAPGRRVLHLATHGFFLDPVRCFRADAGTRGIGGLETSVRKRHRPAFHKQSPLLLSGLALAAANRRSEATPQEDDGILTAEEVASLDLRGVEWAVLSACDTGVGGDAPGEGILGLRRAFRTAGVATLILSLWPVQDQAARDWMRVLYRTRFHERAGTAQAVRAAMLEVLRSRRAQGRSTNPSFWAAFLAAGDWN